MTEECTRTYAVNPDTAEDPCEDCGRDQRKHPAPMVPIHRCASCGELVEHDKRFEPESHGETCRQPEIRMRRLETRVWEQEKRIAALLDKDENELWLSLRALARHVLAPGSCLQPDGGMACGGCDLCPNCSTSGTFHGDCGIDSTLKGLLNAAILKERNGQSPEDKPDTQRSAEPYTIGPITHYYVIETTHPVEQQPDASAAEPERQTPDGAQPAGDTGGDTRPDPGDAGAPESGD